MRGGTLRREEFYSEVKEVVLEVLGEDVIAIISFGSSVYWGEARDLDLLVVIKHALGPKEKLDLEYRLASEARARGLPPLDIHVMGIDDFKGNLTPGTFLSGLALGYRIILDRDDVESLIVSFLHRLSEESYVFYNRYGRWNLSRMARILLRRSSRRG